MEFEQVRECCAVNKTNPYCSEMNGTDSQSTYEMTSNKIVTELESMMATSTMTNVANFSNVLNSRSSMENSTESMNGTTEVPMTTESMVITTTDSNIASNDSYG